MFSVVYKSSLALVYRKESKGTIKFEKYYEQIQNVCNEI